MGITLSFFITWPRPMAKNPEWRTFGQMTRNAPCQHHRREPHQSGSTGSGVPSLCGECCREKLSLTTASGGVFAMNISAHCIHRSVVTHDPESAHLSCRGFLIEHKSIGSHARIKPHVSCDGSRGGRWTCARTGCLYPKRRLTRTGQPHESGSGRPLEGRRGWLRGKPMGWLPVPVSVLPITPASA